MTDNEKEFIRELEQLSRKYKLKVWGCGCCGSPALHELEEREMLEDSGYIYENGLEWIFPGDYDWCKSKDKVVK